MGRGQRLTMIAVWVSIGDETPLRSRLPLRKGAAHAEVSPFQISQPLEVRLAAEAKRPREQAQMLPQGRLGDAVERKATQVVEAAYKVSELRRSPD